MVVRCIFTDEVCCCSDNNLTFVEAPALRPPDVTITQEQIAQIKADASSGAAAVPLPDEERGLVICVSDLLHLDLGYSHETQGRGGENRKLGPSC